MVTSNSKDDSVPVIQRVEDFDRNSGTLIERLAYNYRGLLVLACVVITVLLGVAASRLEINASFSKMMPQGHEFIKNYHEHAANLRSLGNSVTVVVENTEGGSIYDPKYLQVLSEINDEIFLLPGVDRAYMQSLWMASVRWTAVTEQGFDGGPVMPANYDGSPESLRQLRQNVRQADLIGSLVSNDERSSALFLPLLERDAAGKPLDYKAFTESLRSIEAKYRDQGVELYIFGFAKLAGDLIQGLVQILGYFLIAAVLVSFIIYFYTRCVRSTVLVITCSLAAVIWQLGLMQLLGFVLDPFSVLVPFLIFAIGVSHGAQKMNGIMQDIGRGTHKYVAARYTFRRLFLAGLTALLADAVGFGVLAVIDIPAIRDLAIQASIGVAGLIFSNLLLLPVLLSYSGVSPKAASRALRSSAGAHPVARWLVRFTEPTRAKAVLVVSAVLTAGGLAVAQHLKIGDVGAGAPELHDDSEYNQDIAYIGEHYGVSNDLFAVIVTTPEGGLGTYETLLEIDRLEQRLRALPGVHSTESVASLARQFTPAGFEGSPKWYTISRSPFIANDAVDNVFTARPGLINDSRTVAPIVAYLEDHKAETLASVVKVVEEFAAEHNNDNRQFLLAAGNAGIEAATNQTVARENYRMLMMVYAAVIVLCFITFRSWRAVVVAVVPLAVTSVLAEALMVFLGIGVKVATLPVIALGVGIGVDYALYLLAVYMVYMRQGNSVRDSYHGALAFTGKVVALIGFTLSIAVATWAWSPIKFQADMGVLLAFMFLWNMVGALVIAPSLAAFLLKPGKSDRAPASDLDEEEAIADSETPRAAVIGRSAARVTA